MKPTLRKMILAALVASFLGIGTGARAQDLKIGIVLAQQHRHDRDAQVVAAVSDAFLRSRRFIVLERQNLDAIFQEKGLDAFIGDSEGADLGKTLGLDWIGLLTYSVERTRDSTGATQESYFLSVRLLDVASTRVLRTIDSNQETSRAAEYLRASGERFLNEKLQKAELNTWSFSDSIQAASDRLLENLRLAFPPQGYVIQKSGNRQVLVDLGSEAGVREGDTLEVFTFGEPIIHPVTGREIPGQEITRAVLKVLSVQNGLSTCKVKKTDGSFDVGASVRLKGEEGMLDRVMGKLPFSP